MKGIWLAVIFIFIAAWPCRADLIVLKNGKVVKTFGAYEVKGQFVVFRIEEGGPLTQLPVRAVDLDRSEEATEKQKQKEAERLARINAAPPEPPKDNTLEELADYVAETKDDKDAPPPVINLGNEGLADFTRDNPKPVNEQAKWTPPESDKGSVEEFNSKLKDFSKSYQTLQAKLAEINNSIDATQQSLTAAEQNSAFGEDATGAYFELMERFEKKLEELNEQKAEVEKQLSDLDKEARQAGVPGYKRVKPDPQRTDN